MSYQRFCGLGNSRNIPDRTTLWTFENRIGEAAAKDLFDEMDQQLLCQGFIARCGQMVDASIAPAPKQHFTGERIQHLPMSASTLMRCWIQATIPAVSFIADKGYASKAREAALSAAGLRNQIQRKGARGHPLLACQQRCNQRIAKSRARVEHVFGTLSQMGSTLIRTIGQPRANFALVMRAACYNMKRFGYLQRAGIEAF